MVKTFTRPVLLMTVFIALNASAQDIHFSQFYATPLSQNPAFTGFFNGNYRVTGIARSQWRSVTTPYNTIGGSFDLCIPGSRGNRDMYGVGINVTSDRAGDTYFTSNRVDVSSAYNKALDPFGRFYLSAGIMLSYTGTHIDFSRMTFDENFQDGQTTETFDAYNAGYADASAGMQYTFMPNKTDNVTMGAAVYHVNEPVLSYAGDQSSRVNRKYVLNASATYGPNGAFKWIPKINYSHQGANNELNFGVFTRWALPNTKDYGVYFGALHRWKDAAILVLRGDVKDVAVTFSYDFNYSKLAKVSHGMGGPELSVQYIGKFAGKPNKKVFCPLF